MYKVASQSSGYTVQKKDSARETLAFFLKENLHETAHSQVLNGVVGL